MKYMILVMAVQFTLGAAAGAAALWLGLRRGRKGPPRVD